MADNSHSDDPVKGPRDREKAISVAYLRLTGATQEEAGNVNGLRRETVGQWESCSWWPEIVAEASRRWLSGIEAKARKGLDRGLDRDEDGNLSLKVLERRVPGLAPATQKIGSDHDRPVILKVVFDDE